MIDWLSLGMMMMMDGGQLLFGMHKTIVGFLCEYVTQSKQPRPFFYGTSVTRTMLTQFKFSTIEFEELSPFSSMSYNLKLV